jgi:hypothetical protein
MIDCVKEVSNENIASRRQRSSRRTRQNQSSNSTHHTTRISTSTPTASSHHHILRQDKADSLHCNSRTQHRDWIAANVGKVRYNSLRILNLKERATEGEVKAAYQAMSRIYHPDKHKRRIHW